MKIMKALKMAKHLLLTAVLLTITSLGTATTLRVALDGSQPYSVIQTAITASAHGDTVLVYPGRYYENIRFYGKNITLASLELISGDLQYKYSTILDGYHNGPVVHAKDDESNITVRGFSITNGSGNYTEASDISVGGGINFGRLGGQRLCSIINCMVYGNNADLGGGVRVSAGNLTMSGVSVFNNTGESGGGFVFQGSFTMNFNITFDPVNRCSIYNNMAGIGTDIYVEEVSSINVVVDTFTVLIPSNFYASNYRDRPDLTYPYTFDILSSTHYEINHDLHVAPWGDDSNSGLSEADPLKTIYKAVYNIASDPAEPKTIHIAAGYYSKQANDQFFPLSIKSYVSMIGAGREHTVIDFSEANRLFFIPALSEQVTISGLKLFNGRKGIHASHSTDIQISDVQISNLQDVMTARGFLGYLCTDQQIENSLICNVTSPRYATGIYIGDAKGDVRIIDTEISNCSSGGWMPTLQISSINEADVVIDGCRFHDNNSSAPDVWNSIFQIGPFDDVHSQRLGIEISNSSFYNNHQSNSSFMAIVHALNDTTYIRNCTFAGNSGGSAALAVLGNAVLENNVFWDTQLQKEVVVYYGSDSGTSSRAEFGNNCIRGGQNGVYNISPQNQIIWHLNNTGVDPLFDLSGNAPYRLSAASPLIDAGMDMAYAATSTDAGANERYYDGDGNGTADIDIGAYEYQPVYAPANLVGEVWQQTIYLSWQMPVPERSLIGYRIYRDNAIYADILDPGQNQFRDYSPVNDTLSYLVVALYGNVESNPTNSVTVIVSGVGSEDELAPELIGKLTISPNPFSDIAVIGYGLNKQSEVELKIYNLKGQLVRSLHKGTQSKGEQHLAWEGCDDTGRHVGSGIYLLQLKLDGKAQRAMKLVKL